jgi:hypothetical protein
MKVGPVSADRLSANQPMGPDEQCAPNESVFLHRAEVSGDSDKANVSTPVRHGSVDAPPKGKLRRIVNHLTTFEGDPFAHFTEPLLGSIAITFILKLLSLIPNNLGDSAALSVKALTEHIHDVPASLINLSVASAGLVLFGKDLPIGKEILKYLVAPLVKFVLHLLVIGIAPASSNACF